MARRVLFIIYSFSLGGGAEKVLSYLIGGLEARGGYETDLLEVHHEGVSWERLPESVNVLRPVFDETATGSLARLRRGVLRRIAERSPSLLRRIVRKPKRYDLVVAFNYMMPSLLIKPGEPSVSWNHGTIECLKDDPQRARWQREAYANASKVVAIADRTAQSIVELYPEVASKLQIVRNGFPIEDIRRASLAASDERVSRPAVLFVGRLDENKDPLGALEAFRSILSREPKAHLYSGGTGALEGAVEKKVASLGLEDSVHLLGYVRNPYPLMRQADCILSTSHSEGFQSVFIEGFSLGVPFISTPAGAAEELAEACGGGAVIFDGSEAGSAFERLRHEAALPGYRRKLESFAESLSIDAFVDAFEAVAEEAIGENQ